MEDIDIPDTNNNELNFETLIMPNNEDNLDDNISVVFNDDNDENDDVDDDDDYEFSMLMVVIKIMIMLKINYYMYNKLGWFKWKIQR